MIVEEAWHIVGIQSMVAVFILLLYNSYSFFRIIFVVTFSVIMYT